MYSGTTFNTKSGRVMGVHQKIDRIAYRHVVEKLPRATSFPSLRNVLHFEGNNGPDGIKRKSPARDEPWHYVDPSNPDDRQIYQMIDDHMFNMTKALRDNNATRAAFEAAWMAHAIVDGLTPAHHYPLEEKIEELWGKPKEARISIREKNIIKGETRRDTLSKNWQYWGAKGVFTTHVLFEWGVATSIAAQRFDTSIPTDEEFNMIMTRDYADLYQEMVNEVAQLGMYEEFYKSGWNRHVVKETREMLIPCIIKAVTLAWYKAARAAEERA